MKFIIGIEGDDVEVIEFVLLLLILLTDCYSIIDVNEDLIIFYARK